MKNLFFFAYQTLFRVVTSNNTSSQHYCQLGL